MGMMREVSTKQKGLNKMKIDIAGNSRTTAELGIVDRVKQSMKPNNRVAMTLGAIIGGFIPLATYCTAHLEVVPTAPLWEQVPTLMVLGGLIYSALTVFSWAKVAFKHPAKALGFVILLEGTMTFSHLLALSLGALAILIGINAVAAGTQLVLDQKTSRKQKR
jgi:VIT1/CCC1 family predicted Fe2+/Mn2+ transporter